MKNILGREVPDYIDGYGEVRQFTGASANEGKSHKRTDSKINKSAIKGEKKIRESFKEIFDEVGLRDGMTISFHHHLRNGDEVVNAVMKEIDDYGVKDIHLAATGLFPCHKPLVDLMERDVITQISVSAFGYGEVTKAISAGKLKKPAILRTHGGRARAIENGEMKIDVAFIAAPQCDSRGNIYGSKGKSACGCLSYIYPDAKYADYVVAITDNLVPYPSNPVEISEDYVDYVIVVDRLGDPKGIASGAMEVTKDPKKLEIAELAAKFVDASGYIKDGMSLQTGAGGISLAVAAKIRDKMKEKNVVGSFGSGGIHGYFIKMLEEGLFKALWDVQCFDTESVESLVKDQRHMIMSASQYGNPENKSCVVNQLDIMILGGFEVDTDFNLNVHTGSDGVIRAASGGNSDTAFGSKISVVVSELMKKGKRCIVKKHVTTVSTPGETVDAVVTDFGIAINPLRQDLIEKVSKTDLPIVDIDYLYEKGLELGAIEEKPNFGEKIVAVVEYRDGTVIDVIREVL